MVRAIGQPSCLNLIFLIAKAWTITALSDNAHPSHVDQLQNALDQITVLPMLSVVFAMMYSNHAHRMVPAANNLVSALLINALLVKMKLVMALINTVLLEYVTLKNAQ